MLAYTHNVWSVRLKLYEVICSGSYRFSLRGGRGIMGNSHIASSTPRPFINLINPPIPNQTAAPASTITLYPTPNKTYIPQQHSFHNHPEIPLLSKHIILSRDTFIPLTPKRQPPPANHSKKASGILGRKAPGRRPWGLSCGDSPPVTGLGSWILGGKCSTCTKDCFVCIFLHIPF